MTRLAAKLGSSTGTVATEQDSGEASLGPETVLATSRVTSDEGPSVPNDPALPGSALLCQAKLRTEVMPRLLEHWLGLEAQLLESSAVPLSAAALAAWETLREKLALGQPDAPLRNYGVVWAHELSHSGTHKNDSGWQWLRSQGVKTILNFRTENDVDYSKFGSEHVLGIPLRGNLPTDQQGEEFLRFIQEPKNQPVHFHCTAEEDRTGMMVALARDSIDGWPMQRALEDARIDRGDDDLSAKRVAWLNNWAAIHKSGGYRINR